MIVKELIEELEKLPSNARILDDDTYANYWNPYPANYKYKRKYPEIKKVFRMCKNPARFISAFEINEYRKMGYNFKDYDYIAEEVVII